MKRKRDNSSVNGTLLRKPIRRWFPLFMGPMVAAFCIGFVWPFLQTRPNTFIFNIITFH